MTSARCILFALFALFVSPARAMAAPLQEDHQLWAKLSFDGLYWKGSFEQLMLAEGLEVGGRGYIYDPYLLGYVAEVGLIDYHFHRPEGWNTYLGWHATGMLSFAPASKFPLELMFRHQSQGFRPGAHPAFNLSNGTLVGGFWSLRFDNWPQLSLRTTYAITDFNLGPGAVAAVFAEDLQVYHNTRLRSQVKVKRSTSYHSYEMQVHVFDDADDRTNRRLRRARFYAVDR
ncbi:MAG: hypothetical protein JRH20_15385, partial [Deltaproteobacteria bacterium]|nr:hypothetical protein [Deltaproteobacteria bacterium]